MFLPPIKDGNNAFVALASNAKEGRHGHVEMVARGIAPSAIVVGRAKVGSCYGDGGMEEAPLGVSPIIAP